MEPTEVELDLNALEAAVSLARRETAAGEAEATPPWDARSSSAGCEGLWNSTGVSPWRASNSRMPPSSICGLRMSVGGGAGYLGSCVRASPGYRERRASLLKLGLEALGEQVTVAHGHILWFAVVILRTDQESRSAGSYQQLD